MPQIITRRSFLGTSARASLLAALGSLVDVPGFMKRALAEGSIGLNGKKAFFIFLRGGNDSLNSVIPIEDPAYATARPQIGIPKETGVDYSTVTNTADTPGSGYPFGIRLGNGFAALHPALYDLAPLFNAGHLCLIHRVGYPRQSRSHFDSERYWENGVPGNSKLKEGILYRTMIESGLVGHPNHVLTAVSVQSNMPLIIRGELPMTNLSDPSRYDLLGVYGAARQKHLQAIAQACTEPHPDKFNRDLVYSMGTQFIDSLELLKSINFANNEFYDSDGLTHLFPVNAASDQKGLGSGAYGFFNNLKIGAQILAGTNAIVTGTQLGGFDTHTAQVNSATPHTGAHANLMRRLGWAYYALRKFFMDAGMWDRVVVVTLSEFGRTSIENESMGTDHAEAAAMFVGGGAVKGGVRQCHPNDSIPWIVGPANQAGGVDGSMFSVSDRYLRRSVDYRSVLGEIIREHLGATQEQLARIIPGYAEEAVEHLRHGTGTAQTTTPITGELDIM